MKTTNLTDENTRTDASELQEVLTRYIDSRDGYLKAAKLVEHPTLADEFRNIASRRGEVAALLSGAISSQGSDVDRDGSPEAGIHRWWIEMRAKVSSEETEAVLSECIRGERDLERTISSATSDADVLPEHKPMLMNALEDIHRTVVALETIHEAL